MEGNLAHIGAGLAGMGTGIAALGVGNVAANFLAGALRNPLGGCIADRDPVHRHRICRSPGHLLVPGCPAADVRGLIPHQSILTRRWAPGPTC